MTTELITSVLIIGMFFVGGFVVYLIHRRQQQLFVDRFPPISDDEFMARLPPGTNREIALKVRRIVAEQLAIEYERIYPEASFVNDLGAD